jgi:DNA-binding NarL/FixJ family response regulator
LGDDSAQANGPIRVLLADDHTIFRQGLARLLDSHDGIEVLAWVPNDDEVPELARELRPDVVVMEVRVGLEEAGASLYAIRAISPPPKVIVVTMIEDPAMMRAFLRLGASGYVPKSSSTADLVDAIRATASAPEDGKAGAGGLGGAAWVPLTAEDLTAEDIGENGAKGRD